MNEKPILFSGPMVRAILDGRKTMTRRVVMPRPHAGVDAVKWQDVIITGCNTPDKSGFAMMRGGVVESEEIRCPYGQPGDRLWVRETWRYSSCSGYTPTNGPAQYQATLQYKSTYDNPINFRRLGKTVELPEMHYGGNLRKDGGVAWKPSIHMPRWASRLTLEVTAVRVERLREINTADIHAEGVACSDCWTAGTPYRFPVDGVGLIPEHCGCRGKFANLWDDIYAKRGYPWAGNPWVWVIEFKTTTTKES